MDDLNSPSRNTSDWKKKKLEDMVAHMAPLPAADQRHPWLRYQDREFQRGLGTDLAVRLRMVYSGEGQQEEDDLEAVYLGIGVTHGAGDGRGWISSDRDFLGPAPSYLLIRDPMRRLCHRMIAYTISGRGQAPEKVTGIDLFYLCSMDHGTINVPHLLAEGRRAEARLLGGTLLGVWLCILGCRLLRAGALETDEVDQAAEERIKRLEEEVHDLRRDVVGLRGDVASFTTEQSRVSTWLISCMTQLMDASGQTYQPFDSTLVGSSGLSFRRRIMPRTGDAST
ncbi:hypothetical protein Tco_1254320 [Tanacetum coccineum]